MRISSVKNRLCLPFQNTPLSALVVWKYDSVTGEPVEGAIFQVRYMSGTSGTGGTVIGTYKTGPRGSFTINRLKAGAYTVEELASDGDHVMDTAPQTAYISGKEQDVVQLYFGNSPKGSLLVKKIDASTHEPLSDCEFFITDSHGTMLGDANGKFVTDSAGTILISNIDPGTTLVVRETRAKENYILDDVPQTVTIKAGQTVSLEFRNQPKGSVTLYKFSSLDRRTPLEGVGFKITFANGQVVDNIGGKLSSKGLYTTNANGEIRVPVVGTVVVKEVKTLPTHVIDGATRIQTVTVNPADTQTITVYNEPRCSLTLTKKDAITGKPVPNTEFTLKGGDGNLIGRYTTGADGTVTVTGPTPNSTVVVVESRVPSNYVLDPTPHVITVRNGSNSSTITSSASGGTSNGGNSSAGGTGSGGNNVVVENVPKVTLTIEKYLKTESGEKPLKGATFLVTDQTGAVIGSSNGEFTSDENGRIVIPNLEPGTTVTAKEISVPDGVVLDSSPKSILIKAGEQGQTLRVVNQATGYLVIKKLDS